MTGDSVTGDGITGDSGAEMLRVVVDNDSCIGAGQCEMLEAETFLIDDDTMISSVIGTGMLPRERALQVVERCPGRAISIALE